MIDEQEALMHLEPEAELAGSIPGFEKRDGQDEMVSLICRAVNEQRFTVIEAGTGIGKSFAYLIPLILAAGRQEDAHYIVSTGTINLQYQLYEKDLPFLCSHIDPKIRFALLMGRGNYLCRRRLQFEAEKQPLLITSDSEPLAQIFQWAKSTRRGIKTELQGYIPPEVWQTVSSDADVCLGGRCTYREQCFVNRARKEASEAQIVVVNHHVLYADVSVKREAESFHEDGLLPAYDAVVCDEAHRIEDSARQYFSQSASTPQLVRILSQVWNTKSGKDQGVLQRLKPSSRDPQAWEAYPASETQLISAAEAADAEAGKFIRRRQKYWLRPADASAHHMLMNCFSKLSDALKNHLNLLERIEQSIDEEGDEQTAFLLKIFSAQCRKLKGIQEVCSSFQRYDQEPDSIYWLEALTRSGRRGAYRYMITPHSASPILREALFDHLDTLIAVSATLAVNGSFHYWRKAMGLEDKELMEGIVPSPFDYRHNVMLGIPVDAPPVESEEAYTQYLQSAVTELASLSEGRTLVLFTSFQMLQNVYEQSKEKLAGAGIESLIQQPGSDRYKLLEAFKEGGSKRVLFATDSFWEGIDVPGEALQQVIITRLPFQVPVEPVYQARQEKLLQEGGNPFMELAVPRAAMKLKQGFGRLIRTAEDRGIVLILDKRPLVKAYGSILLGSLPETYQVFEEHETILRRVEDFLFS